MQVNVGEPSINCKSRLFMCRVQEFRGHGNSGPWRVTHAFGIVIVATPKSDSMAFFHTSQFCCPQSGSGASAVAAKKRAAKKAAPPTAPFKPIVSPRKTNDIIPAHKGCEA